MLVNNKKDLAQAYRQGPWAWPGGYPVYPVLSDGALLCWKCLKENYGVIAEAVREVDNWGGWRVLGLEINWEDTEAYCEDCNTHLESAYGEG